MKFPWVWLPLIGPIRLSTIAVAILIAVVILLRRRSPLAVLVTVLGWLAAYEIAYQGTGVVLHGWPLTQFVWLTAALSGWVIFAHYRGAVPHRMLLLAFTLAWLAWIVFGFNSNSPTVAGTPGFPNHFSLPDEILNELTKSLLGFSYVAGALKAISRGRSTSSTRSG